MRMKWQGRRQSTNVEDRRGMGGKTLVGGGIGGIVLVLVVMLLGGNPSDVLNSLSTTSTDNSSVPYEESDQEKELASFVSVVLADTEDVWKKSLRKKGKSIKIQNWFCITAPFNRHAEPRVHPSGRFTVRVIKSFTLI